MLNIVIAENLSHARAMIRWLGLDDDLWLPMAYGSVVKDFYTDVLLVRPLGGITEEHGDWFIEHIVPNITGEISTVPPTWRPENEAPVQHEIGPVTLWA